MTCEIRPTPKITVIDDVFILNKDYTEIEFNLNAARNHLFEVKSQQKNNLKAIRLIAPEYSFNRSFILDTNAEDDGSVCTWRCESKQLGGIWAQMASGNWKIGFTKKTPQTLYVKIKVLTEEIDAINPILMNCRLLNDDQKTNAPIVVVDLKRRDKVVGAFVTATVDRPNGTSFSVILDLIDDLYFAYLDKNTCLGDYLVNVLAVSNANTFRRSQFLGKTCRVFQRQQFAGVYTITAESKSGPKNIPHQVLNEMRVSLTQMNTTEQKVLDALSPPKILSANALIEDPPPYWNSELQVLYSKFK